MKHFRFSLIVFLSLMQSDLFGNQLILVHRPPTTAGAAAPTAAPAFVEAASANSTGATGAAITIAAGNDIIGCARVGADVGASITDDQGTTYTELNDQTFDGTNHFVFFYSTSVGSGSRTVTLTPASGTPSVRLIVVEVSNLKDGNPTDDNDFATGSSDTPTSPAITTTDTNTYIFGCATIGGTFDFTAGSGYTERIEVVQKISAEDKTVAAAGSNTATYGLGGSSTWGIGIAAFKGQL